MCAILFKKDTTKLCDINKATTLYIYVTFSNHYVTEEITKRKRRENETKHTNFKVKGIISSVMEINFSFIPISHYGNKIYTTIRN